MKNFKKIASAIAALSLAACMVAPVATMTSFADDSKGSITITNPTGVAHTYEAYQIFDGDLTTESTEPVKYVLSNITWGTGVSPEGLVSALKGVGATFEYNKPNADTEGTTVTASENPFAKIPDYSATADTSAKEVAAILPTLTENGLRDFLKIVGAHLETATATEKSATGDTPGATTFSNLDPGYYFIKDKDDSLKDGGTALDDAYTRYMVQVLGEVETINPKSAKPSVDKQVFDLSPETDNDKQDKTTGDAAGSDGWGETADHAIGEQFQFKLTAKMPKSAELDAYNAYTLKFTDKMAMGVTYEGIESVTIYYTGDTATSKDITNKESVSNYTLNFDTNLTAEDSYDDSHKGDGEHTWTLTIADLVKLLDSGKTLKDVDRVEVVYNAHLNEDAVVTNANVTNAGDDGKYFGDNTKVNANDVFLEYSNNPNKGDWNFEATGDTDTGKTTPDTVGVFTYEVDSTKYADEVKSGNELAGAKFRLSKTDGGKTYYAKFTKGTDGYTYTFTGNWVESTAESLDGTEIESYAGSTPEKTNAGKFNIKGLDAGTYKLVETAAPSGYNILNDPVDITIYAEHAEDAAGGGATLKFSNDAKTSQSKYDTSNLDGTTALGGNIINQKGAQLPSTGGIGTTLFYLGGGALVAVAGVMLITKKRMTKE